MPCRWLPDYVAVDIETTGLAAQQDELLEIAGVRFVGGIPVDRFSTTLQIDHAIARRTARLTGLTDSALAEGLPVAEALQRLDAFAGDLPLVAHNVSMDREFLTRYSRGLDGVDLCDNEWWDSLELAALVFPELDSLALEHVANALKLEIGTLHRADADATLAGLVFSALFAHIEEHWPPALIETIRSQDLAEHHFGALLRLLPLTAHEPPPLLPLPIPQESPLFVPPRVERNENRILHIHRVDQTTAALSEPSLEGHRLLYPPHLYPGQFHGPDKELRQQATALGLGCHSGHHCLLDREKLELLLAGGIAVPGQLRPFERALLRAWSQMSPTTDFARLSWWVLNNFPTLAATLNRISIERSDRPSTLSATPVPEAGTRLLPWEAGLAERIPWGIGYTHQEDDAPWAVLVPVYYPLHALRASIRTWQISALREELTWLGNTLRFVTGPLRVWWTESNQSWMQAIQQLERALAAVGADVQHPSCVARGEEHYWPIPVQPDGDPAGTAFRLAIRAVAEALATYLPAGRIALGETELPVEQQRLFATILRRLESFRIAAHWMGTPDSDACLIVVKQQYGRDLTWWGIAVAPRLPRDIATLVPDTQPLPMISTFLDQNDWKEVERLWQAPAAPATSVMYEDHTTPIPPGNTVHIPLPPPGVRGIPAKKIWQTWQLSILRRLIQQENGRWLIVARNPQDVVTLHHRMREPLLQADWQPLFQRHDGTKGFLMREFGSFEKVAMIATGEILQELNRFPVPPDTIVILHVPTRPPNELVCVALQQQLELSSEEFREDVMVPLGILDFKRALFQWSVFRAGEANVYLLDFRQLELPALKMLLRASFPNQELIDTRPAVQY